MYKIIRAVDLQRTPSGTVRFEGGPGVVVVAAAEVPHKFKNIGTGRLELICIHPSPQIIQELVEE